MLRTSFKLSLLSIVAVSVCPAQASELLVGGKSVTAEQIAAAVRGFGKVLGKNSSGMYRVSFSTDADSARGRSALNKRGIKDVYETAAEALDNRSLKSVRDHIAYTKSAYETRTGLDAAAGEKAGDNVVTGFYKALEHWLQRRVDKYGNFDPDWLLQAAKHRDGMPGSPSLPGGPLDPTGSFEYVGPKNLDIPYSTYYGKRPLSGRKSSVTYAPSNGSVIYVASSGGGLWKSTDGGLTWSCKSDDWIGTNAESVAVHPTDPNTVYVGTGDYEGFPIQTYGIMKSTNGGTTWTNVGASDFGSSVVSGIVVMPDDPNVVIAITGRGSTGSNSRIWRSTNAGGSWTATNAIQANWDDLDISAVKQGGGYDLYAVGTKSGIAGGYIYKSTDSGASWNATGAKPQTGSVPSAINVACSKIDPNVVYVLDTSVSPGGIYKSTTGGTSWGSIAAGFPNGNSNYNWSQRTYDYHIMCGKNGVQDAVFVGLITVAYSPNGGSSWVDVGNTYNGAGGGVINTHNDQHCFAVHPTNGNEFIIGNDGGVHRLVMSNMTTGAGTWTGLNSQIHDTMIYEMDVHATAADIIITGTQDNASPAARNDLANWDNLYAGDGAWPAIDRLNDGVHYSQSQGMSVYKYTSWGDGTPTGFDPPIGGAFIAPMIIAGDGKELFCAGNRLCYHPGHPAAASSWVTRPTVISSGNVEELAAAPSNGSIIYTGDGSGQVWRTQDEGINFIRIDAGLADRSIGAINVSWTDPNDILVGFADYGGAPHIFRTTNANSATPTWTDITANLPNVGVQALTRDPHTPNTFYAGTDVGAFMTTNAGVTWTNMHSLGLPNVQVTGLHVNSGSKTHLYVSTYGRGVWRIAIANSSYSITGKIVENGVALNGATVTLAKWQDLAPTVSSAPNLPIPDNNTTGVTANLYVPVSAVLKSTACRVKITHTFIGDLTVTLRHPDGTEVVLHNRTGGSTDNIDQTYTTAAFNGKNSTGTWKLIVKDLAANDTGVLNNFDISPTYEGYSNVASTTTAGAGTYGFSGQGSGKYRIYPTLAGKMFGPKWRLIETPPSATLQDFAAGPIRTLTSGTVTPNIFYGLTSVNAAINISGPAPFPMQILISRSSPLIYSANGVVIPTGATSAPMTVTGGNVTSDLIATVTWTYYEQTRTATVTVKPKPVITGFTMTPSSVQGGNPSTGTITISKPAITGTADMSAILSDNSSFATTPGNTTWANGATQSSFSVPTFAVTTTTPVTISAYFYNSTRTATLTLTP